jgi:hypothetical protein
LAGCYGVRPSNGAGQVAGNVPRICDAQDIAVPSRYRVELIAKRLTFPTGVTFDKDGIPCAVDSGYAYGEVWTLSRLLRVKPTGTEEFATGAKNGPWTGVTFHEGNFCVAEDGVMEGGRILRIQPDGKIIALVSDLPSFGDHHSNGPLIGPDGMLYFG